MKKYFAFILAASLLLLSACTEGSVNPGGSVNQGGSANQGSSAKQDALIDYINNDMAEINELEIEMLESYKSVIGDNYIDDETTYTELNTVTLPLCRELNGKATDIQPDDREIAEAHRLYRNYTAKMMNAFNTMLDALEKQDRSIITQANDMIIEAEDLYAQYEQKILDLAEERNVTFGG